MDEKELYKLRFPVGEYEYPKEVTEKDMQSYIKEIEEHPAKLRKEVQGLTDEQLNTSYRPNGWTIRQVVHHLPDAHVNGYIRF